MNFETPWAILGWIAVSAFVVVVVGVLFVIAKEVISQLLTDRRRKRAHRGKVKCEGGEWVKIYGDERNQILDDKKYIKCPLIATRKTPKGYFCEEHWSENSYKGGMYAGVSYGHKLNHVYTGPH